eukprot:TRINITY_DN22042_c0_g1_i2.p1 TRINITY_DN22042_c0_g1~~TRINITY_DN22042_c0_g1_i2.p1  ORF type:complete len:227 (-),score=10.85 TRINITY_DN22042_c0_g1_i2:279-872(-)
MAVAAAATGCTHSWEWKLEAGTSHRVSNHNECPEANPICGEDGECGKCSRSFVDIEVQVRQLLNNSRQGTLHDLLQEYEACPPSNPICEAGQCYNCQVGVCLARGGTPSEFQECMSFFPEGSDVQIVEDPFENSSNAKRNTPPACGCSELTWVTMCEIYCGPQPITLPQCKYYECQWCPACNWSTVPEPYEYLYGAP